MKSADFMGHALLRHRLRCRLRRRADLCGTAAESGPRTPRQFGLPWQCAGEDLNLHGVLTPQGPQPCASTNSATSARGREV